ncbi:MAG: hypothetical protein ACYTGH_17750 [Planctomycetota bacterium]|jgi:hypothetical protein
MTAQTEYRIPETHEIIRLEDLKETLDLFSEGNEVLPQLSEEQLFWLDDALHLRKDLCAAQFGQSGKGTQDESVLRDLQQLDADINLISPDILTVLHYLCRIRALVPMLTQLKSEKEEADQQSNEYAHTVADMKYRCAVAEAEASIQGLAEMRVRPRLLDSNYLKSQLNDGSAGPVPAVAGPAKVIAPPTAEETEEALDLFFSEENAIPAQEEPSPAAAEATPTVAAAPDPAPEAPVPSSAHTAAPAQPEAPTSKPKMKLNVKPTKKKEIKMASPQCRVYIAMKAGERELAFPELETAALARHIINMAVPVDAESIVVLGNAQGEFSLAMDSVAPPPPEAQMNQIITICRTLMLLAHDNVLDQNAVKALLFTENG